MDMLISITMFAILIVVLLALVGFSAFSFYNWFIELKHKDYASQRDPLFISLDSHIVIVSQKDEEIERLKGRIRELEK